MTLAALQDYVFTAKYARWRSDRERRETWDEACDRVFAMHRRYLGERTPPELAEAETAMRERLVLGSQRALQFGGEPIERHHERLYNCTVSYCDRPRFFQEALFLLLCGCGVGFSVQHHHVARLPNLRRPHGTPRRFVIADTIEGWADALGALIEAYLETGEDLAFDFSEIRPAGSALRGASVAPGPEPLRLALSRIRDILNRQVAAGQHRLRPIDCYDITMHASDAVLSGGVRRSASLCLFSPDDHEMATAKTGDWFTRHPQRGRSNNSALLLRNTTTKAAFTNLLNHVREFGEPGFVWADSTEIVYNPCCEIGMFPVDDETGSTGWAFCNLCEINVKACPDATTLLRAARAAAILGTVQASWTNFPYLGAISERIVRREALLGVSMTGMMDRPELVFDAELQRRAAAEVLAVNADLAARLGIACAARATCVKPAGTTSLILGTASGIHPHHARRYLRRVQANREEAPARFFATFNPQATEASVWNPNGTDVVLTFCVEVPPQAIIRSEVGAVELLRHVRLTQTNWVAAGRRPERCVRPFLTHNVSNTITVRDHEWTDVADELFTHRQAYSGVALLPWGGDLEYPQAPFVAIVDETEQRTQLGPRLDAVMDIVDGQALTFNWWDSDRNQFPPAFTTFVRETFANDERAAIHACRRWWCWRTWQRLTQAWQAVDYRRMREIRDGTGRVDLDPACAGGACPW
jgi:ribonucleoside-triphosphate reductase (thioredoxin)